MLQIGHKAVVINHGGEEIAKGSIEAERPMDCPCGEPFVEFRIGGQWYPEWRVYCAACGHDLICPQCGAEADLEGMLYA